MLPDSKQKNVAFKLSQLGLVEGYFSGALESKENQCEPTKCSGQATRAFSRERSLQWGSFVPLAGALHNTRAVFTLTWNERPRGCEIVQGQC